MDWTDNPIFTSGTNAGLGLWVDGTTDNTIALQLPDEYINWLPYSIEKYLPTWHLMRSYD